MLKPEERDRKKELGQLYLKEGNCSEALKFFREVYLSYHEEKEAPPELLSLYGYTMAMAEQRFDEGIILCTRALKINPDEPAYYLNLGKIYLKAGKKDSAVKVFRRGLKSDRKNLEILLELKRLGLRRRPIITFLPREHPINKFLGIMVTKFAEK